MRAGFNPIRRNRNIGTVEQGHGQDNELVIPNPGGLYSSLDRIGEYVSERRCIAGTDMTFIVERLRAGCLHACSIDNVTAVLERLPKSDWAGIETVVFRQPTRKQAALDPAWGSLRYAGEVSTARKRAWRQAP